MNGRQWQRICYVIVAGTITLLSTRAPPCCHSGSMAVTPRRNGHSYFPVRNRARGQCTNDCRLKA